MAQKALKTLASRNKATLNRTHLISFGIYTFFLLLRTLFFTRRLLLFVILILPALTIEFWFERIARPTYNASGEPQRAGEDLEAKGLTEWMWDVLYWTWACTVLAAGLGDWAWWAYVAVPLYSAYLAFTTYSGVRKGMGGMGEGGADAQGQGAGAGGQSKRQAKMEKRGGQRVQYR